MPRSNKKTLVKKIKLADATPEVKFYIDLVNKIRESDCQEVVNDAFEKVVNGLETKIKKIAGKFKIPGHTFDDTYQECLYALRYKAIKDYDEQRGAEVGKPAPFDRFALLCIRRHLATTLKASHQNSVRPLNEGKSLDQDRSQDNDELSLINIVCSTKGDILSEIQDKENFKVLMSRLLAKLSPFERQVFMLYARQFTYEEIAEHINGVESELEEVNIKGVDNALSRIKNKARTIAERIAAREQKDIERRNKPDNSIIRNKRAKAVEPSKNNSRKGK
jgi:RNA polymerase sporulation-specific sigma factor